MIAALKVNQENLCKLPKRIKHFVGRDKEIKDAQKDLLKGEKFIVITGGPCYGKSSLATEIGDALFEKPYNYVIWIRMRDIPSNPPSLEDVAQKILEEFNVYDPEMKGVIVNRLIEKFESITSSGKKALLIFDNADKLITQENTSCTSTTYDELCDKIHSNSRESIRAIFTTRVGKNLDEDDHYNIKLKKLSDQECEEFLSSELANVKGVDKEHKFKELVSVSQGLPMALQLICSRIKNLRYKEMVEDYINNLNKDAFRTVAKYSKLQNLFALSLEYLDESDKNLLSLLATFPSRFSYEYTKVLISHAMTDDSNIGMRLQNLEDHNLIQDDSQDDKVSKDEATQDETNQDEASQDEEDQDEFSTRKFYVMHPFFCQFIKEKYWQDNKGHIYEKSYYCLYIQQLFILSINALEKDNYVNCLKEFQTEQHNFFHVMTQIGKGLEEVNQSNHLKEIFCEELNQKMTPDYIAACLFCIDLTNPSLLLRFFEGCEALVDEKLKKNIWCCRYDLNMKYYDEKVDDPQKQLEPDEYGRALLDKRLISSELQASFQSKQVEKDFTKMISKLTAFKERVASLKCKKMKAYFLHKILKMKGDWQKKALYSKTLGIKKSNCVDDFNEALQICKESFGENWLTIDCYNQLGKLHWRLKETEEATLAFDKAIEVAESMSLKNIKKFGACLLDKGRFLVDSSNEEKKAEGRALLENVIEGCKDFSEINFWCRAMSFLLKVDKSKAVIVKERFCDTDKLNSYLLAVMDEAIRMNSDSFDVCIEEESLWKDEEEAKVKNLCEAIEHLESALKSPSQECDANDNDNTSLLKDANKHLFVWQMKAALKYNHILPLSERKIFAKKALDIMESCPFIDRKKEDDLRRLVNYECSLEGEDLLRERHYIDLLSKHLLKEGKHDELMERYSKLLGKCEDYQEIWSSIVLKISRDNPVFYKNATALLIRQPKPCEDLLKLVHFKFQYDIRIYKREADESIIMRESQNAVEDLEKAIKHVEKLLNDGDSLETDLIKRLDESLFIWYKSIALDMDHCLIEKDRVRYAEKVLGSSSKLKEEEKKKLVKIKPGTSTDDEQEQMRKKSLLIKITKFMRRNDMQGDLEGRYWQFLMECSSFPRIRFEMVRYILKFKNVDISMFTMYLQLLLRHFEDGSLNTGWDYQFVIDLAHGDLFSNKVDRLSRAKNYEIYRSIYNSLRSSKLVLGLKKKLEFEFLVIFSLKIGSDGRDDSLKKQEARDALRIFPTMGAKHKSDRKLLQYKEQLERLIL